MVLTPPFIITYCPLKYRNVLCPRTGEGLRRVHDGINGMAPRKGSMTPLSFYYTSCFSPVRRIVQDTEVRPRTPSSVSFQLSLP